MKRLALILVCLAFAATAEAKKRLPGQSSVPPMASVSTLAYPLRPVDMRGGAFHFLKQEVENLSRSFAKYVIKPRDTSFRDLQYVLYDTFDLNPHEPQIDQYARIDSVQTANGNVSVQAQVSLAFHAGSLERMLDALVGGTLCWVIRNRPEQELERLIREYVRDHEVKVRHSDARRALVSIILKDPRDASRVKGVDSIIKTALEALRSCHDFNNPELFRFESMPDKLAWPVTWADAVRKLQVVESAARDDYSALPILTELPQAVQTTAVDAGSARLVSWLSLEGKKSDEHATARAPVRRAQFSETTASDLRWWRVRRLRDPFRQIVTGE